MANQFSIPVPSILDALSAFDKGYSRGDTWRKEGLVQDAGRSLQSRNYGSAIDQLMGAGQLDAGLKVMGLQEAERTRGLQAQAGQNFLSALTGQPSAGASGQSASDPQSWGNAIAGIESGGRYDALGPLVTKSGDRAYGKYQVMGNNIPEWTQAALGRRMTPQEFLADPQAQDAVFQHRFGQYAAKYGPEGAARAWFAGEGGMNNPNAKDQLGTSVQQYGQRFAQAAGVTANDADPAAIPPNARPAQYVVPGTPQANGPTSGQPSGGMNLSLRAQQLIGAMANPNLPANMKDVAKTLLAQEFEQNKTPEAVRQYLFAKGQGFPGTYMDFQRDLRKAGATNVTVGGESLSPGQKKIDESFADTYLRWNTSGFADSAKQLTQLNEALGILEKGGNVTGAVGVLPDFLQPFINEQGTIAREGVEEVVQRSLREILGAQFTEKEGDRLIARAFNPRLKPEENVKRVRRLFETIKSMGESTQAMVQYFEEHGTLRGYKGRRPSMGDFNWLGSETGTPKDGAVAPAIPTPPAGFRIIE